MIQIELPPRGEAEPQPRVLIRAIDGRAVKKEKGPYLGVSTSTPMPALRHQLKLPDGVGLVVDFLDPKSPADEAGLRQYDILQKLDDQLLINQQQLAVLVRTYKPGDEVKLTVIRDGKSEMITAKLAEKELPPLDQLRLGEWEGMDRWARPDGFPAPPTPPGAVRPPGPQGKELHLELRGHPENLKSESMTLSQSDGKTSFTLTSTNGHRHLQVKDKDGKVLFDSAIDTPEQLKDVPKDILKKLAAVPWMHLPSASDDKSDGSKSKPGDGPDEKTPDDKAPF